ncbi:MAG: beta-mannanase, partial [Nocardiopsaceae bacterium]|nr:beta-mannanase [Nocardiopsaceae bacterium]
YVDWVGITGYLAITGPQSYDDLYGPTMADLRRFTGTKPFIIAETSVETGPAELSEIESLVKGVKSDSDVLGLVWFNYDKDNVDWTLTDRTKARATFANLIANMPLVRSAG